MTDKPKFGDAVNVPLSEMAARGIGPMVAADLTEESFLAAAAQILADKSVLRPTHFVVPLDRLKAELAKGDPLYVPPKKPRAKYGTATYGNRDPDARRKYLREYMAKRRAAAKAIINQPPGD